uniref:Trichome birefringence-like N-terminal domain-containing protein n=1 Tax=Cannabis sativa TaxID=3483 RepID=A0A803P0T2_CANSA
MQPPRRKTPLFPSEPGAMKGRKNNNLSIFVVVFSIFLFGVFMYNEDVKSIAEFPFSRPKAQEIQETMPEQSKKPAKVVAMVEEGKPQNDDENKAVKNSQTSLEENPAEDSDETPEKIKLEPIKEEEQKIELPVLTGRGEEEENDDGEDVVLPPEDCDLYTGEWVYDNSTHPLYKEDECEFSQPKSLDWDNPDGIKCAKETMPIQNISSPIQVGTDRRLFVIANNITGSLKIPVHFLNITTLSEYRKDAHTSVHTIRQGKMLTPEQQADPATYADCIHWCLPGLPDTWNEFLYTRIISRS